MNRNILLAVSAAALMGTLRAESPFNIQINLGQAPILGEEGTKQVRVEVKTKIAETDLEGRLKAIVAKLNADLNALLAARNKEIVSYRTRLFAHFETMLKQSQASGDLEAYEKWKAQKNVFQKLRTFDDWAQVLSSGYYYGGNGEVFYAHVNNIQGIPAPDFEKLYSDSIKEAYQAADKAEEEVQRDALKQGNIKAATFIREWRQKTLPRGEQINTARIIHGRKE